jgi:hypothetical protein
MSGSSDLTKSIVGHAVLAGLIGFMRYTSTVLKNYQEVFVELIDFYNDRLREFYDFMVEIIVECKDSYVVLNNIKALLVDNENKEAFDQVELNKIKSMYSSLEERFTKSLNTNKRIRDSICEKIEFMKIKKDDFKYCREMTRIEYTGIGIGIGGFFGTKTGCTMFKTVLSSAAGALVGAGGIGLVSYCNSYIEKASLIMLKKLKSDMSKLIQNSDISAICIEESMLEAIETNVKTVETNIRYGNSFASSSKGKKIVQAEKMMKETTNLIDKIELLETMAHERAFHSRKMLGLENLHDIFF